MSQTSAFNLSRRIWQFRRVLAAVCVVVVVVSVCIAIGLHISCQIANEFSLTRVLEGAIAAIAPWAAFGIFKTLRKMTRETP